MLLPTAVFLVVEHDPLSSTYEGYGLGSATMAQDVLTGTLLRQAAFITLGTFGLLVLARRRETGASLSGALGSVMIFFLAWCFASLAWSSDLSLASHRMPVLAAMCVAAPGLSENTRLRPLFVGSSFRRPQPFGIAAEVYLGAFLPRRQAASRVPFT
jgi:hypothetical protein